MPINPVPKQRGPNEAKSIDQGTLEGSEYRAVHDGQGVGHRKRRRRDDGKDCDGERVGKRTDRADLVGDARLVADHQECKHERGGK